MPTLLHVGSGLARKNQTTAGFDRPDWTEVRLDIDPCVNPDVIGTMTDMSAVPDGSIDGIFSSHNIEHLYAHEVPAALAEFLRVLKPEGFVVITCPDMQSISVLVAQGRLTEPAYISTKGPISAHDIIYGFGEEMAAGNLYMAHRCGFTLGSLAAAMDQAGFGRYAGLRRAAYFDLWIVASKAQLGDAAIQELAAAHFPRVEAGPA